MTVGLFWKRAVAKRKWWRRSSRSVQHPHASSDPAIRLRTGRVATEAALEIEATVMRDEESDVLGVPPGSPLFPRRIVLLDATPPRTIAASAMLAASIHHSFARRTTPCATVVASGHVRHRRLRQGYLTSPAACCVDG